MNKTGKCIAILVSALMILGTSCKKSDPDETKKKKGDNWPIEVNLSECYDVSAEGVNGMAELTIARNEGKLEKEEKRVGEELQEKDIPYRKNDLSGFFQSIEFVSDASESIKNGDLVTIKVRYDDSLARACNIEPEEVTFTYMVSGLSEQKVIYPFEGLDVKIEGYLGRARISLDNSRCSEDCRNNVTYNVPDINDAFNGKTVTITASLSDKDNYILSSSEMEVTVDGLYFMYTGSPTETTAGYGDEEMYMGIVDKICAEYTEFLKNNDRTVTFQNGDMVFVMTEATITGGQILFARTPTILTPLDPDTLEPNGVLYDAGLKINLTGKVNGEEKTFILDFGSIDYVHLALVHDQGYNPVVLDETKEALYYCSDFTGTYVNFDSGWGWEEEEYCLPAAEAYITGVEDELKKTFEIGEKPDRNNGHGDLTSFTYEED